MSGGPDVGGCSWLFLLKADGGLILPGRGMGLLRSPSQASQLLHGPHMAWSGCVTCGEQFPTKRAVHSYPRKLAKTATQE
ncbi:hypothetical protein D3C76_1559160 [compost metagenome]